LLYYILTSSHRPPIRRSKGTWYCLQETADIGQHRDSLVRTIARTPPPAFLFPNQQCQRPGSLPRPPLFSAGGRRRRLSSGPPRSCQPILSDLSEPNPEPRDTRREKHQGRRSRPLGRSLRPGRGLLIVDSIGARS